MLRWQWTLLWTRSSALGRQCPGQLMCIESRVVAGAGVESKWGQLLCSYTLSRGVGLDYARLLSFTSCPRAINRAAPLAFPTRFQMQAEAVANKLRALRADPSWRSMMENELTPFRKLLEVMATVRLPGM